MLVLLDRNFAARILISAITGTGACRSCAAAPTAPTRRYSAVRAIDSTITLTTAGGRRAGSHYEHRDRRTLPPAGQPPLTQRHRG
ncbi:hypothetical protein [Nonomuraea indica]|uniref:Secreted protein n=1 Tax=Nonomuraea indica TaxID=1581193 RepID=A0ABW8ABK5_9ACTN